MKVHKVNVEDLTKQNGDTPFLTYCRKLIKEGNSATDSAEMYRNGILSLSTKNIGEAAKLAVKEDLSPHFVKYTNPSSRLKGGERV